MINKLEALAKVEGGLLLIMIVCALLGLLLGLLLGYWVGYLVGKAKGAKMRNLTASLDDLTQTLTGLRVKRVDAVTNKQPGPEARFKKFPV